MARYIPMNYPDWNPETKELGEPVICNKWFRVRIETHHPETKEGDWQHPRAAWTSVAYYGPYFTEGAAKWVGNYMTSGRRQNSMYGIEVSEPDWDQV